MRLHEALHQLCSHHAGAWMDRGFRNSEGYRENGHYVFFNMMISAHVFDGCPAIGSAMYRLVNEGYGYSLYCQGGGRDFRSRNNYQACADRARRFLLQKSSPDVANYVIDSFSFGVGLTYSENTYNDLNRRYEELLRSAAGSSYASMEDQGKTWSRYVKFKRIFEFVGLPLFKLLIAFLLLGLIYMTLFGCFRSGIPFLTE